MSKKTTEKICRKQDNMSRKLSAMQLFIIQMTDLSGRSKKILVLALILLSTILSADTEYGDPPLHNAAASGRTETVKLLLDKGANINEKNKFGYTPLHNAADYGRTETIKVLLDKGANINEKTESGYTPLHNAAASGRKETVGLLLDKGAIDCKTEHGITAAKLARKTEHPETAILIEQALKRLTLEQLLEKSNFEDEAFVSELTDTLIEAKNLKLPEFISQSTVQQRVALLTILEKRLVQAQKQIAKCNSDAGMFIRQGKEIDAATCQKLIAAIQAYQSVLNAIKEILNQS